MMSVCSQEALDPSSCTHNSRWWPWGLKGSRWAPSNSYIHQHWASDQPKVWPRKQSYSL